MELRRGNLYAAMRFGKMRARGGARSTKRSPSCLREGSPTHSLRLAENAIADRPLASSLWGTRLATSLVPHLQATVRGR